MKQIMKIPTPNSRTESIVIMLSFVAILIPLRIVTKAVFQDGWLGSLGVLTAVITLLIVLSHKDKLGWYGRAFIRQITKMHKGKRKYLFFAQSLMLILFGIFIVYSVNVGNSDEYIGIKNQILDEFRAEGIPVGEKGSMEAVLELTSEIPIEDQIEAMINLPVLAVKEFQIIAISFAISNDLMDGWLLYLWQVILIESIEFMGIFIVTKKYVKAKETK